VRLTPWRGAGGSRGATVPQFAAWRSVLRRHLAWLLLLKFAALALLWALFFSPAHRTPVDGWMTGRQLALGQPAAQAGSGAPTREEGRRD
jgi:hypothetical protein